MQKINYNEKIEFEDKIKELVMINIDDRLEQIQEKDCIKIAGIIKVSGEVSLTNHTQTFSKEIEADIMLSKEQIQDAINITIDDFNYTLNDNILDINLIMKIDGLKEIEAYFPSQEDQEVIEIVDTEIETNDDIIFRNEELTQSNIDEDNIEINDSVLENNDSETLSSNENSFSLLRQVFKNKNIQKEKCYNLHVIKTQTTYEELASLYQVDNEELKSLNKNEELYIGKLIFIPFK